MPSLTRDDLLALTADRYCAGGYTGADGALRREFRAEYATAACTQFLAAELSPQELALTAEAVRQVLPLHDGPPGERANGAADEALSVVAHAIRQSNNEVLARWLKQCAVAVRTEADLQGFLAHLLATERQYALVAPLSQQALSQPASLPPDPAASPGQERSP